MYIPKDERSKLDDKTKQCIFLGYGHEEFGYRLWDPVDKKVIRSRDVIFFEDQTIKDFDKSKKTVSLDKEYPVKFDLNSSPKVHDNHEGEVRESNN